MPLFKRKKKEPVQVQGSATSLNSMGNAASKGQPWLYEIPKVKDQPQPHHEVWKENLSKLKSATKLSNVISLDKQIRCIITMQEEQQRRLEREAENAASASPLTAEPTAIKSSHPQPTKASMLDGTPAMEFAQTGNNQSYSPTTEADPDTLNGSWAPSDLEEEMPKMPSLLFKGMNIMRTTEKESSKTVNNDSSATTLQAHTHKPHLDSIMSAPVNQISVSGRQSIKTEEKAEYESFVPKTPTKSSIKSDALTDSQTNLDEFAFQDYGTDESDDYTNLSDLLQDHSSPFTSKTKQGTGNKLVDDVTAQYSPEIVRNKEKPVQNAISHPTQPHPTSLDKSQNPFTSVSTPNIPVKIYHATTTWPSEEVQLASKSPDLSRHSTSSIEAKSSVYTQVSPPAVSKASASYHEVLDTAELPLQSTMLSQAGGIQPLLFNSYLADVQKTKGTDTTDSNIRKKFALSTSTKEFSVYSDLYDELSVTKTRLETSAPELDQGELKYSIRQQDETIKVNKFLRDHLKDHIKKLEGRLGDEREKAENAESKVREFELAEQCTRKIAFQQMADHLQAENDARKSYERLYHEQVRISQAHQLESNLFQEYLQDLEKQLQESNRATMKLEASLSSATSELQKANRATMNLEASLSVDTLELAILKEEITALKYRESLTESAYEDELACLKEQLKALEDKNTEIEQNRVNMKTVFEQNLQELQTKAQLLNDGLITEKERRTAVEKENIRIKAERDELFAQHQKAISLIKGTEQSCCQKLEKNIRKCSVTDCILQNTRDLLSSQKAKLESQNQTCQQLQGNASRITESSSRVEKHCKEMEAKLESVSNRANTLEVEKGQQVATVTSSSSQILD